MDQPASNAVLITEMAMWAQRTVGHLILAGVFERYPTLRFVPTEQGTYWVPGQIGMLDAMVPTMKSEAGNRTYGMFGGSSVDALTLTPSEYVKRNCYFATELTPFESGVVDYVGPDHIMWGSDYPHEEGFSPHSKLAIRWALHNRSEDDCRKILGGTAGRLIPFRSRRAGAGGDRDRSDCRRGAHSSRGHGLSRPRRFRLPTVRGRTGPQAAGSRNGANRLRRLKAAPSLLVAAQSCVPRRVTSAPLIGSALGTRLSIRAMRDSDSRIGSRCGSPRSCCPGPG